jgi:hypothetical protein
MVASQPETWFDFHRDVLYIRWDKFEYQYAGRQRQFDDLIYYISYLFDEEVQGRIENLAILMNKKGIRNYDGQSFEEFLSYIPRAFGGVKTLTLVAKNVGYYPRDGPNRELSFLDPIDTDRLEVHHSYAYSKESWRHQMHLIHGIPELDIDWLQVDSAELKRLSNEITEERPTSWAVPKIEYKIVVPGSYLPFLDWIEEKRIETLEWEKEQEEYEEKRRTQKSAQKRTLGLLSQLPFYGGNGNR